LGLHHGGSQRHFNETPSKAGFSEVTILHPAHPLLGQLFPVIQQSSAEEVLIELSNGQQYYIPIDWTDQAAPRVSFPGACFLLENLLTLQQRLEAISQKKGNSGPIPSQSHRQAEGEKHATAGSVHIIPAFPGTACPGDRYFGTNDPATMEQAEGGGKK
jgi:hypothetical protein